MRAIVWGCAVLGIAGMMGLTQVGSAPAELNAAAPKTPTYEADIKPILTDSCIGCHGAQKKRKNVDVSSYSGLMKTVVASKPGDSKFFKCVTGNGAKLMPPRNQLDDDKIATIKAWIAAGAKQN